MEGPAVSGGDCAVGYSVGKSVGISEVISVDRGVDAVVVDRD